MSTTNRTKRLLATACIAVLVLAVAGYTYWRAMSSDDAENTITTSGQADTPIDLDNGDKDIDWDSLPTTNITLGNETLAITSAGTYVLSGETAAGVTVNTDGNVRLALNNATIKHTAGAAIYIENAENTVIQLVANTSNTVEDGSTRSDETIDGAIYSSDDLIFDGTGSLAVTSRFADAIVSKDDLKIASGAYTIDSIDDGIRGKDSVYIAGGTITVDAAGDGIKSTNDADESKGFVYIGGGNITIRSGDDAIKGEQKVTIAGGVIVVESSVEGIEAAIITIDGGDISIYASDDGINASASALTTSPVITINGGTVDITVGAGDTDAIDSNGDIYINGGTITITAPTSSIDYEGVAELNGGTVKVNGATITTIPRGNMGGGGNRMW